MPCSYFTLFQSSLVYSSFTSHEANFFTRQGRLSRACSYSCSFSSLFHSRSFFLFFIADFINVFLQVRLNLRYTLYLTQHRNERLLSSLGGYSLLERIPHFRCCVISPRSFIYAPY